MVLVPSHYSNSLGTVVGIGLVKKKTNLLPSFLPAFPLLFRSLGDKGVYDCMHDIQQLSFMKSY